MIKISDLSVIAIERLQDAEALFRINRHVAAAYLSGYSIELTLKRKICNTLNWSGFPSTNSEFANYKCLKTHDLNTLLTFTGLEKLIKENYLKEWLPITRWNPEIRYDTGEIINIADAEAMIASAKNLIKII